MNVLIIFIFRFFRVIPANEFLKEFASDRRHMKRPDGTWIKPPPNYPAISTTGQYNILKHPQSNTVLCVFTTSNKEPIYHICSRCIFINVRLGIETRVLTMHYFKLVKNSSRILRKQRIYLLKSTPKNY